MGTEILFGHLDDITYTGRRIRHHSTQEKHAYQNIAAVATKRYDFMVFAKRKITLCFAPNTTDNPTMTPAAVQDAVAQPPNNLAQYYFVNARLLRHAIIL